MPEETLLAFGDHGTVSGVIAKDGGTAESTIRSIRDAGVDVARLRSDYRRKEPRGSLPLGTIYSKQLRRRAKRLVSESFPRHSSVVGRSHILSKNLSDHVAVNIGQSSIDAVVFES